MSKQSGRPMALISVTDKTGIIEFTRGLIAEGFEILSTGGTAKLLSEAGISVIEAGAFTGFPEILDGRVKTLHPKIHAGILYDRSKVSHLNQCREFQIQSIDLVVVNLYQFSARAVEKQLKLEEAIEFIDVGGPTMLRAAAKNYQHVAPVIDPDDYNDCLRELKSGGLSVKFRQRLAAKTFRSVAQYDAMIASYFEQAAQDQDTKFELQAKTELHLEKVLDLRYGENPHQQAGFYSSNFDLTSGFQKAQVIQGKELSYNNLLDCDAASTILLDFPDSAAAVIVKHTNPCGAAVAKKGSPLYEIFQRAFAVDTKSAFGGIVAVNQTLDVDTAREMSSIFLECIVAPDFTAEALEVLAKKKNLRLLKLPLLDPKNSNKTNGAWQLRSVLGGLLIQQQDQHLQLMGNWKLVSKTEPTPGQNEDLNFAMRICKHVKSNAIVFVKNSTLLAVGAGQMSRIDSVRFAGEKAKEFGHDLKGAVMASDAFFPFRDSVDLAASFGISAIIQPGGSLRDEESIQAANEHRMAMVTTGMRHFKH